MLSANTRCPAREPQSMRGLGRAYNSSGKRNPSTSLGAASSRWRSSRGIG